MFVLIPGQASAASVIEVDDDAASGWYDATHVHTIEEGVAAAANGDTVLVHPGTYLGTATVNKRLNLVSTDGAASTIVRSTGTYGIRIYSDWVNVTGFTSELADYGIDAVMFHHCTVNDCVARDNDVGIRFHSTDYSRLEGCNVTGSKDYGIYLYDSPGIVARGNWIYENGLTANQYGGLLIYSDDARLERNRFFNNTGVGLRIYTNDQVSLENNTFENNGGMGLSMEVVTMTHMRNNTFNDNRHDFYILGNSLETFQQDIDSSNMVSGGPIYYYLSGSSFTVPSDAGMVGLVQCTNVTVEGLSISKNGQGVILAHSSGCTLEDLVLDGCYNGFELYYSDYNTIQRCLVNGSGAEGALLRMSSNNLIVDSSFINAVAGVAGSGVLADFSHHTRVERCNMSGNYAGGVYIRSSNFCHVNDSIARMNVHGNGVFAYLSNYMSVRGNNVSGNGNGILISQSSSHSVIENNQVFDNLKESGKRGIDVYYSDLATITNNTVVGNHHGIYVYASNQAVLRFNTAKYNQVLGGIHVYDGRTVVIENNTAVGNEIGIVLENPGPEYYDYNNSVIANNTLLDSEKEGFKVDGRLKNATIAHNIIEGAGASYYGLYLDDLTRDNLIFDNRIVCPWNVYDAGTNNTWNVSKAAGVNIIGGEWMGGNYFSNYSGTDADLDGIGDVPFAIAGPGASQDMLPLMTEIALPSVPQDLMAIIAPAQVTLSWSPPLDDGGSPVTNYSVYRGASPGTLSLLEKTGAFNVYVDDGMQGGQTYYYAVSAHNAAGEGAKSMEVMVVLPGLPSAPDIFSVDPGDGQVQLTWFPPVDDGGAAITNYSIYRGPSNSSLTLLVKLGNVTSYLDEGVSNGNVYYYALTASNVAGEGAMTPVVSCIPAWTEHYPSCVITSPTGEYVITSDAAMTWTMSDLVSGIDFAEVRLDTGTWVFKDKATSHVFTGVADGRHTLSLRIYNNAGYANSTSRLITVDTTPPTDVMRSWVQSDESGTLQIEFSEAMGSVLGLIDGEPVTFSLSDRNATALLTLEPGSHSLNMTGIDLAGNPLDFFPFDFNVAQVPIQVDGLVIDEDGDPIADADVSVNGFQTTTDANGWFTCQLLTGQYVVNVTITAAGMKEFDGQFVVANGELGSFTMIPLEETGGDEGVPSWVWILIVVVIVVAFLLLLLFWKRKKKEEDGKKK